MKQSIGALKYWLRLHRIPLSKFGTGMKNNPIKVKSKKESSMKQTVEEAARKACLNWIEKVREVYG